jgi:hypothetical protein
MLAAGVAGVLLACGAASAGASASAVTVADTEGARLSPVVERLAETSEDPGSPEFAESVGVPANGALSLRVDDGRLAVTIETAGAPGEDLIRTVDELGTLVTADDEYDTVVAYLPPTAFAQIAELPGVASITEVSAGRIGSALSAPTPGPVLPIPTGTCRSIPEDAAIPLGVDAARTAFGVDGTGITVGVISDSFDFNDAGLPSAADDVANGLLPGPGNPCGYTTPVIVHESPVVGTDEGRGMVQLVHAMAPGATLAFASGDTEESHLRQAIRQLADDGADVIVDDVLLPQEPYYQQSSVSTLIDRLVREEGLVYLAAAGNYNQVGVPEGVSAGLPIGSWGTEAYRPTECPADVVAHSGFDGPVDCLDFDPLGGGDPVMGIVTVGNGTGPTAAAAAVALLLQWAEPVGGVAHDFALVIQNEDGTWSTQKPFGTGFPGRQAVVENSQKDGEAAAISVVRPTTEGDDFRPAIRFSSYVDGPTAVLELEHDTTTATDTVGASVNGHNGGPETITVAAAAFYTPTTVEPFSSLGPVTYLFTPVTPHSVGTPLATPEVHAAPDILSVDAERTSTTSDTEEIEPGVYLFQGTSAASPTAAGVVALGLQRNPSLTPDEVKAALYGSAFPVSSPYADTPSANVTGAGLIDAEAFLAAIPPAPVPAPVPSPDAQGASATLAATGTAVGGPALGLASLLSVLAGAGLLGVRSRRPRLR